jgi:hypothetical protein
MDGPKKVAFVIKGCCRVDDENDLRVPVSTEA